MPALRYQDLDPLHPESEAKVYTVHLSAALLNHADVTSAAWTCLPAGALTIDDSSFANPGEAAHTAVEVRDGVDYDGALLTVTVSNATAVEGDTCYLRASFETDFSEGPLHKDFRVFVTALGL